MVCFPELYKHDNSYCANGNCDDARLVYCWVVTVDVAGNTLTKGAVTALSDFGQPYDCQVELITMSPKTVMACYVNDGMINSKSKTQECKMLKWNAGDGATAELVTGRAIAINTPVKHNSQNIKVAATHLVVPTKLGDKVVVCFQNAAETCPSKSPGLCGGHDYAWRPSLSIPGIGQQQGTIGCKFIELAGDTVMINRREYVNNEKDDGNGQTFVIPTASAGLVKELKFMIPVDNIWGTSLDEIMINRLTSTGEVTRFSATYASFSTSSSLGANVGRSWLIDKEGTEVETDGIKRSKMFVR